ncbi:MAG TPA: lipopolysaccharide heptosyltransferase II [Gemmataceae bacterium]|nr:lipopolysaccharide heptosyltransferase II [Gemmataceae bacterium]
MRRKNALTARQFDRILLIKPSAFGDVLHALPVLVKLRARYPKARIDWLITPENADLVRHHPALSNTVLFARRDYGQWNRMLAAGAGLLKLVSALQSANYDLVIDLHGQFRSALFTLASGAPVRIGFDRPVRLTADQGWVTTTRHGWRGAREGSWLAYTHRIPIPTLDVHAVDRYLWLRPILGLNDSPADLRVYWPAEFDDWADSFIRRQGIRSFALLVPGTLWRTKHWHEQGFAAVGRYLMRQGLPVILLGTKRERARCEAIAEACPGVVDLSGQTTLSQLAALMNRSSISVTNDSGSMHLAVALNRPVVSVFGPTNPSWVGPYGRADAVVRVNLPCSPCYFRRLSQCPNDHACMKQISPEQVIERIQAVFARTGNASLAG